MPVIPAMSSNVRSLGVQGKLGPPPQTGPAWSALGAAYGALRSTKGKYTVCIPPLLYQDLPLTA